LSPEYNIPTKAGRLSDRRLSSAKEIQGRARRVQRCSAVPMFQLHESTHVNSQHAYTSRITHTSAVSLLLARKWLNVSSKGHASTTAIIPMLPRWLLVQENTRCCSAAFKQRYCHAAPIQHPGCLKPLRDDCPPSHPSPIALITTSPSCSVTIRPQYGSASALQAFTRPRGPELWWL
jgi:hypothetical protein